MWHNAQGGIEINGNLPELSLREISNIGIVRSDKHGNCQTPLMFVAPIAAPQYVSTKWFGSCMPKFNGS